MKHDVTGNLNTINSVQGKIKCLFDISITNESTSKRPGQNFQVYAAEKFNDDAVSSSYQTALISEKIDGTCCYITPYQGKLAYMYWF